MIVRTSGVLLRVDPFSKTSQITTWLTPEHGRMVTLVKGAQRRRGNFVGQYDLFYTCELLFYCRERTGLHLLKECSPLETRCGFRHDWRAAACASYCCDLAARLSPLEGRHPELFALMGRVLDALGEYGPASAFVFWFELRALGVLGFAPQLRRCAGCGSALPVDPARIVVFSVERGGILCPECQPDRAGPIVHISPDIRSMLTTWQSIPTPELACRTAMAIDQREAIEDLLGAFLRYHLDPFPGSRETALALVGGRKHEHVVRHQPDPYTGTVTKRKPGAWHPASASNTSVIAQQPITERTRLTTPPSLPRKVKPKDSATASRSETASGSGTADPQLSRS
jgi:DNA repair protein RecO (recombination protein O)